jgi:hypothetical protein
MNEPSLKPTANNYSRGTCLRRTSVICENHHA